MKTRLFVHHLLFSSSLVISLVCSPLQSGSAATLDWDPDTVTPGIQDGPGSWTVGGTTFWDGGTNVATTNDTVTDIARFGNGGTGGAVTVSAQSINGLIFDTTVTAGYSLSGGILTIGNSGITANAGALATSVGNALVMGDSLSILNNSPNLLTLGSTVTSGASVTQTLTVSGSGNTTINGLVNDGAAGTLNITKTGAGYLLLGGATTNINGALDIQGGTIGSFNDFVATGLTGTGTLENASAADKWSFWNIAGSNTFDGILKNGTTGLNVGLLGIVKQGVGTLTLTNNASIAQSNLQVEGGRLILNNTGSFGSMLQGGLVRTGHTALIGSTAGQNGILEINGATVNYNNRSGTAAQDEVFRSTLSVGTNATSAGNLRMTSGSLTTRRQLALGTVAGSYGAYTQSGGVASVGGFLALGLSSGRGVFNQSGGTYTMTTGPVTNGAGTGSIGVMNLSGTAVYNQNGTGDTGIWVGESGTGIINVSGSAALNFATVNNGLQLGRNASGVGIANLLGGNVTTKAVAKGAGSGTLNFNGGTLTANAAAPTFLTGLSAAYVRSGGGTIDNGGNVITIGQALLAPTGDGVSSTGLTTSGGGYIDTPLVTITGGGGSGATAVANIDGSGNLTGITVTNAGIGYTSAPTFALVGGGIGNTGALGGAATLVTNTSGGMTFAGTGTTALAGNSTYTGATVVSAGTLYVHGTLNGTSGTTIGAGATAGGNGDIQTGTVSFTGAGTINAGTSVAVGELGVLAADLTLGTLRVEYDISTIGMIDLLTVSSLLDIAGSTVDFDNIGSALDGTSTYVFATYGSLTGGAFAGVTDLPTGYLIDYGTGTSSNISLVPIPETSSVLLGAFGALALLRRRREA